MPRRPGSELAPECHGVSFRSCSGGKASALLQCGRMDFPSLFLLLSFGLLIWFWLDSLRAREIGVAAARDACADEGLQFLDDTVVGRALSLARDDQGRLRLRRVYAFEYSDTGDNRRPGSVTMLGHEIELLHVRPKLYVIPSHHEQNRD